MIKLACITLMALALTGCNPFAKTIHEASAQPTNAQALPADILAQPANLSAPLPAHG